MGDYKSPENGMRKIRLELENPPAHPERKTTLREFFIVFQRPIIYVIAVLLWLSMGGVFYFFYLNPLAGPSVFVLSNLKMNGPSDLCPGDMLDFQFNVDVKEVGTYNLYMSTWKVDPPPSIIIFSENQPFVIGSERSFVVPRKWKIPVAYNDPANAVDTPMLPGRYTRDISVAALGRNTSNKPLQVAFNVKKNCPSLKK